MASQKQTQADWYAWAGWTLLFLVTAAIIVHDGSRTVVPSYRIAALNWFAGRGLYDGTGVGGFVYFPQAALLFAPFALLPPAAGEVLWRLAIIGVFAAGVYRFSGLAGGQSGSGLFPLTSLAAVLLAWDCARNGQATLIMAGFMLLAVVELSRGSWWRATLWLVLAVAVKPLAVVLVLLVMAAELPMAWRLLLGLAALALAPFLTQHPAYVAQQYASFLRNTTTAAHVGVVEHGWTSPFTALRTAGVEVPERVQTAIRIAGAFGTLALFLLAGRRRGPGRSAVYRYSLAALYLILFSPRTENNTYAMLGPTIGVFLAAAFLSGKRTGEGILLSAVTLALIGSRQIERLAAPHAEQVWLSPLLAACLAVYVLARLFAGPAGDGLAARSS